MASEDPSLDAAVRAFLDAAPLDPDPGAARAEVDRLKSQIRDVAHAVGQDPDRWPEARALLDRLVATHAQAEQALGRAVAREAPRAPTPEAPSAELDPAPRLTDDATDHAPTPDDGAPAPVAATEAETDPDPVEAPSAPQPPADVEVAPEPAHPMAREPRHVRVKALLDGSMGPRQPKDLADGIGEIESVEALCSGDKVELARVLDSDDQRSYLTLVTAWLRFLQDHPSVPPAYRGRIREAFSAASTFSKVERPGWVNGLAHEHEPESGSWFSDASRAWTALVQARKAPAQPSSPPSRSEAPKPKPPARSSDDGSGASDSSVPSDGEETEDLDLADWWVVEHVAGRRAVIVGGDAREERRAKIEQMLGLQSLEWVATDSMGRIQSLADRILAGSVDLVLLLTSFMSHKVSKLVVDACRDADVTLAYVDRGYGSGQIRLALESALAGSSNGAAPHDEPAVERLS